MPGWLSLLPERSSRTYVVVRPGLIRIDGKRRRWIEPGEPEMVGGKAVVTLFFEVTEAERTPALLIQNRDGTANHTCTLDGTVIDLRPILDAVIVPRAMEMYRDRVRRVFIETMLGREFYQAVNRRQAIAIQVVRLDGQRLTWNPQQR